MLSKVVVKDSLNEGPGFKFVGSGIDLEAISDPQCEGSQISWEITEQPASSSVANPPNGSTATIVPTHLGEYTIKASCGASSDTFILYSYQIEFERDTTNTHISMEGHPPNGDTVPLDMPGTYGTVIYSPQVTSFVGASASLSFAMSCDDVAYIAEEGAGSWLQPSGEVRYNFYVNLGSATANLKLSILVSASGSVSPITPLIAIGAGPGIAKITVPGTDAYYTWSELMKADGSGTFTDTTGSSPVIYSGSVNGRVKVGSIEAGVGFKNFGVPSGTAIISFTGNFDVSKP